MEDIFGNYLMDYFMGKECYEITERDDGFISFTPIKRYFNGYSDWPVCERIGMKFVKGKTLDIGCGAGRHSLFLQRNGQNVVGIDHSKKALKVADLRGLKNTYMLDLDDLEKINESFDTFLMLGNNFGLLEKPKKAQSFLSSLYNFSNDNAIILAGSKNPYKTDNEVTLNYLKKNKYNGKLPGQLKIRLRYRKKISDWFDFMLVSPKEMHQIFDKTGWELVKIIKKNNEDFVGVFKK